MPCLTVSSATAPSLSTFSRRESLPRIYDELIKQSLSKNAGTQVQTYEDNFGLHQIQLDLDNIQCHLVRFRRESSTKRPNDFTIDTTHNTSTVRTMVSASPSPHKPRRRNKKTAHFDNSVNVKPEALIRTPSFPLAAFLWPARSSLSQWEVLPLILMVVGLFRWAAGLWGYSGKAVTYTDLCPMRF